MVEENKDEIKHIEIEENESEENKYENLNEEISKISL
jgi:hypothetical protein